MEAYAVISRTDNRVYLAPVEDEPCDVIVISEADFEEDVQMIVIDE